MTEPPGQTVAPRGRPRNVAVDRAVVDTVLRLLIEGVSFGDLSMVAVARETGVSRATVYRRWPTMDALLLDVLEAIEDPLPEPAGRSLREDLVNAVEATRKRSLAKHESALMRNMLTQIHTSPQLWQAYRDTFIVPRRQAFARILERGLADGEIRPEYGDDLELLVDMVVSPVLSRATLRPNSLLEENLAERVVDAFLQGVRPKG
ncbi:TetR/AcrR family transcriptional regulator [Streptomyces sp. NBC_01390]|uniref:TetR/AcrR family transcriptional regulator C-terminal ligand-binding domain-containing protein n=1 Tax=Streptomyces sp. NBC_01390 TaxID=2903850 RepID=UPI0032473D86